MRSVWRDGDRERVVEIEPLGAGRWRVRVDGAEIELGVEALPGGDLRLSNGEDVYVAEISSAGAKRFVHLRGMDFVFEREAGGRKRGAAAAGGLEAPMPGVVTRVLVAPGDEVAQGQPLVALEAMKMEHLIRSPRAGRVKSVAARAGEMVTGGLALVVLEEEAP